MMAAVVSRVGSDSAVMDALVSRVGSDSAVMDAVVSRVGSDSTVMYSFCKYPPQYFLFCCMD
jgi:hypothetical protein